ncbi:hypothetical protein PORY_002750 [Pneumocystis oryctolagi]|uniref:Uncharacterized protein n=1 Tax=Pneumocystis oryctolagi TaxID=42067 RepID=A0ACB7C8U9_9ASCO|nr:hypothetical protein PORY_002750 [Pneumocystis oryctolagi]
MSLKFKWGAASREINSEIISICKKNINTEKISLRNLISVPFEGFHCSVSSLVENANTDIVNTIICLNIGLLALVITYLQKEIKIYTELTYSWATSMSPDSASQ